MALQQQRGDREYFRFVEDVNNSPAVRVIDSMPVNAWRATRTAGVAGTATLVSAPGNGKSLYLTDIFMSNGATAGSIRLYERVAAVGNTILVDAIYFAINGNFSKEYKTPVKLAANASLDVEEGVITTHTIQVVGYTI